MGNMLIDADSGSFLVKILLKMGCKGGQKQKETPKSLTIVENVLNEYGWIQKVEQITTDRGSQYYANKKDKNGRSESQV